VTDNVAKARAWLRREAGRYLRNVVRERGVTCRVCATPVDGFELCWCCRARRRIAGLADLVVPLTYAIANTESATLLQRYKNYPVRTVRQQHSLIINWLLLLGISLHERCVGIAAGLPVSLRLAIPSLTSRTGVHPFVEITRTMNALGGAAALVPAPDAVCDRVVGAHKFALQPDLRLDGQHVLVLDDTWTTGSNAQSAALTLRRAGACAVSVMVVGRWLSPRFARTSRFIESHLQRDYDPDVCPVTGGRCP
jgi:adenine/guanine phosphoribosyltransferase-like PRPP-binding protein